MKRDRRLLALRLAVRMLTARRARTALSVAAVATGVAAVITVAAIGAGTRAEVLRQIESLGTNLVVVSAGKAERVGGRARRGGGGVALVSPGARAIGEGGA